MVGQMNKKKLLIDQLETRISRFSAAADVPIPPTGWVTAIRLALGMSMQQLANMLSMTRQSVYDMEKREREGSITLRSLREAAHALDMDLVYGFVPKDGSLEKIIDKRAQKLAESIVMRASQSMKLEDQENTNARLLAAVEERKETYKRELPKELWD